MHTNTQQHTKSSSITPKTASALIDPLLSSFNKSDAPGLVIGVAQHGQTIYRAAFGLASVRHNVANSISTRMRIGSTSKHFTCLCVLLLAEDGKFDIDTPITELMDGFRFKGQAPTLRQLMNHTSGMRCSLDLWVLANEAAPMPKGWQLDQLAKQEDVNFLPGEGQLYCNGGYHLLSAVVDKFAGMPFETFLQERVLKPLGMWSTEALPNDLKLAPDVATNHLPDPTGGWRIGHFSTEEVRGEGSMVSTVDDMLRWISHLRGSKRVGSDATWQAMLSPPLLPNGLQSNYSLGLYQQIYRGLNVIHHAGAVMGGNSQMLTVPSHELDVVLMVNGAALNAAEMGWKLLDTLLAQDLSSETRQRPKLSAFARINGTRYHGASGTLIGFGPAGEDQLGLSFNGTPPLPLLWEVGKRLRVGFEDAALGPIELEVDELKGEGDAPHTITYRESGRIETLHRVGIAPPPVAELALTLVGRYRSHDLSTDAEIVVIDGVLVIQVRGDHSGVRRYKLRPWSDKVLDLVHPLADSAGVAAMTVEKTSQKVQRFRIDGVRARRIAFDRLDDHS